uniref:Uncharacterized protein n=1 Tax=Heterosigma akashiwo TaxID=2829 RepID=A0A7S3XQ22_HETAK
MDDHDIESYPSSYDTFVFSKGESRGLSDKKAQDIKPRSISWLVAVGTVGKVCAFGLLCTVLYQLRNLSNEQEESAPKFITPAWPHLYATSESNNQKWCSNADHPVLGGVDVIALRTGSTENSKGSSQFSATLETTDSTYTFHFVSEENMKVFQAQPWQYAPSLGGFAADIMCSGGALGSASPVDLVRPSVDLSSGRVEGNGHKLVLFSTQCKEEHKEDYLAALETCESEWDSMYGGIFNTDCHCDESAPAQVTVFGEDGEAADRPLPVPPPAPPAPVPLPPATQAAPSWYDFEQELASSELRTGPGTAGAAAVQHASFGLGAVAPASVAGGISHVAGPDGVVAEGSAVSHASEPIHAYEVAGTSSSSENSHFRVSRDADGALYITVKKEYLDAKEGGVGGYVVERDQTTGELRVHIKFNGYEEVVTLPETATNSEAAEATVIEEEGEEAEAQGGQDEDDIDAAVEENEGENLAPADIVDEAEAEGEAQQIGEDENSEIQSSDDVANTDMVKEAEGETKAWQVVEEEENDGVQPSDDVANADEVRGAEIETEARQVEADENDEVQPGATMDVEEAADDKANTEEGNGEVQPSADDDVADADEMEEAEAETETQEVEAGENGEIQPGAIVDVEEAADDKAITEEVAEEKNGDVQPTDDVANADEMEDAEVEAGAQQAEVNENDEVQPGATIDDDEATNDMASNKEVAEEAGTEAVDNTQVEVADQIEKNTGDMQDEAEAGTSGAKAEEAESEEAMEDGDKEAADSGGIEESGKAAIKEVDDTEQATAGAEADDVRGDADGDVEQESSGPINPDKPLPPIKPPPSSDTEDSIPESDDATLAADDLDSGHFPFSIDEIVGSGEDEGNEEAGLDGIGAAGGDTGPETVGESAQSVDRDHPHQIVGGSDDLKIEIKPKIWVRAPGAMGYLTQEERDALTPDTPVLVHTLDGHTFLALPVSSQDIYTEMEILAFNGVDLHQLDIEEMNFMYETISEYEHKVLYDYDPIMEQMIELASAQTVQMMLFQKIAVPGQD